MTSRRRPDIPPPDDIDTVLSDPARSAALFRLTLSFMAVVLMTFVAVEGWRIWRDYRHAFENAEVTVSNLARATAQHAEDAIRQVDVVTAALAERIEGDGLDKLDPKRLHAALYQQARIMPQLHGLFVYDARGRWLVTDKDVTPQDANNADRAYFSYHRNHRDRGVQIGSVVRSRSTGDLIIPISRRLEYADGHFAGVILGTIKVDWFVRYYGAFEIDERGALVLAKRDGTILVRRPFIASQVGRSLVDSEIFRNHLPYADEGVTQAQAVVDGTWRLYAYKALSSYPLLVEAGLSRDTIMAPWRHDVIKTAIVLLLLVAGLSAFGWVVLRQLRERLVLENALQQANKALENLALSDGLTGLGNRRQLDNELAHEVKRAQRQGYPIAAVMLDLDYFKLYNDHYGHQAGDACLRRVGDVLRAALKRPADLAVRYGGEEFTLLLPDTDQVGAEMLVNEVLQRVRDLDLAHAASPLGRVTLSAGIAVVLPGHVVPSPETLTGAADQALYEAKRQGRDRYWITDAL
ncbi:diguanylate cyclase domain-containing protein [Enterobacterales bacterium AW_CKDN230030176-1A_HGKHYDSX7]